MSILKCQNSTFQLTYIQKRHQENHQLIHQLKSSVNSINCYTFDISRFADYQQSKTFHETSKNNKINNFPVSENSSLVIMDCSSVSVVDMCFTPDKPNSLCINPSYVGFLIHTWLVRLNFVLKLKFECHSP